MRALFKLRLILCYVGIAASVVIHLMTIVFGGSVPSGVVFALHAGIIIFIPVALAERRHAGRRDAKNYRRAFWSASPLWLRNLTWGAFAYFVVVFLWYNLTPASSATRGNAVPPRLLVMFSAGWLSFYSVLAAGLHFQMRRGENTLRSPDESSTS